MVPVAVTPVPVAPDAGTDAAVPGALVRAAGTDNLFLLSFDPAAAADEVPMPVLNVLPGGPGVTDTLPLVTPRGLRVFTLGGQTLAAVDPATGARKGVTLPFSGRHLVPYVGADGAQQALVWTEKANAVAFARLDEVEQARGRAVSVLTLQSGVDALLPIPGRAAAVAVNATRLVILDFVDQTATPFDIGGSLGGTYSDNSYEYGYAETRIDTKDAIRISDDGAFLFAAVEANGPRAVAIDLETGAAGSVSLERQGRLLLLPGADRLVVDHADALGAVSVLPAGALDDAEVERHTDLFLTEVFSR